LSLVVRVDSFTVSVSGLVVCEIMYPLCIGAIVQPTVNSNVANIKSVFMITAVVLLLYLLTDVTQILESD